MRDLLSLKKQELNAVNFNMREEKIELRAAIYRFISRLYFDDTSLRELLTPLQRNVLRFESERALIYRSVARLSALNSELIQKHIPLILGVEDVLFVSEPVWNEPVHVLRIVMLANAVQALPLS